MDFVSCENIFGALKYAKYRKFLPFLLPCLKGDAKPRYHDMHGLACTREVGS
jgi:hypothetical protein